MLDPCIDSLLYSIMGQLQTSNYISLLAEDGEREQEQVLCSLRLKRILVELSDRRGDHATALQLLEVCDTLSDKLWKGSLSKSHEIVDSSSLSEPSIESSGSVTLASNKTIILKHISSLDVLSQSALQARRRAIEFQYTVSTCLLLFVLSCPNQYDSR